MWDGGIILGVNKRECQNIMKRLVPAYPNLRRKLNSRYINIEFSSENDVIKLDFQFLNCKFFFGVYHFDCV